MLEGAAPRPRSRRLIWRPLAPSHFELFHRLIGDGNVGRHLPADMPLERAGLAAEIERSAALFAARGVGLWLLWRGRGLDDSGRCLSGDPALDTPSGEPVGFAGFRVFDALGAAPRLVMAFASRATGFGLATEAGRALLDVGHGVGLDPVYAAVRAPDAAALRVSAKLGFMVVGPVRSEAADPSSGTVDLVSSGRGG